MEQSPPVPVQVGQYSDFLKPLHDSSGAPGIKLSPNPTSHWVQEARVPGLPQDEGSW